jgi:lipopolysaccharide/colanic/teichoic acid biosynthesis glycosyltransferase
MRRTFDLVVGLTALVVLSPVLVAVATVILLAMGRPVLFRQVRPGRDGRPFVIYKFRTMRPSNRLDADYDHEAERLTALGRFLRATSLDELPELVNVLRGDMSLVGPRPLLAEYLPLYTPQQARRHLVRPGITGLAQVSGRNRLSWERRLALDVFYVDHQSLWLDLKILVRTLGVVLRRDGIAAEGRVTGFLFTGRPSGGGYAPTIDEGPGRAEATNPAGSVVR